MCLRKVTDFNSLKLGLAENFGSNSPGRIALHMVLQLKCPPMQRLIHSGNPVPQLAPSLVGRKRSGSPWQSFIDFHRQLQLVSAAHAPKLTGRRYRAHVGLTTVLLLCSIKDFHRKSMSIGMKGSVFRMKGSDCNCSSPPLGLHCLHHGFGVHL